VLSELKMFADECPEVANLVQSVLNNSLLARLNKRMPMQSIHWTPGDDNVPVNAPLDFIKAQYLLEVEKLSKTMTEIHAQVAEKTTHDRKAAIQKHNDKTHVHLPKFQAGDYVLVAEHHKSGTSEFKVKWKGSRRIAGEESEYVFVVENFLTKELKAAHATRLRFYQDEELG
jgi:hypothetical protein